MTTISILIPIYNYDIVHLLARLIRCIGLNKASDTFEIVMVDDCSNDLVLKEANRRAIKVFNRDFIGLHELNSNVGRALVRNLLVSKSRGEYLLFMDSDVLPNSDNYLLNYIEHIDKGNYDVVCGGVNYLQSECEEKKYHFHRYLSQKNDVKSISVRNSEPWRYVHTANIMVKKHVMLDTPFDKRFSGYGYEDCEWGIRLIKKYNVLHIDNTVSHLGLSSKHDMYGKMNASIGNYRLLMELQPEIFNPTQIGRFVIRLSFLGRTFLNIIHRCLKHIFFIDYLGNFMPYLAYQLDKAVLLALAKNHNEKHVNVYGC